MFTVSPALFINGAKNMLIAGVVSFKNRHHNYQLVDDVANFINGAS